MKSKITSFLAILLLFFQALFAQSNLGFNYQAIARDGDNKILAGTDVTVDFIIHTGSVSGPVAYQESHSVTTNDLGLISLEIGSRNRTLFEGIAWANGSYFLEVKINDQDMGTRQFLAVPYSKASGIATDMVIDNLTNVNTAGRRSGYVLKWTGSSWEAREDETGGGGLNAADGLLIIGDSIYNIGDVDATDDITDETTAGGDLAGTYPNPSVVALRDQPIANVVPQNGQILKFEGGFWRPSADLVADSTGQAVNTNATLSGDGAGTALGIARQNATNSQVLKWNGTTWVPAIDDVNDADSNPNNEIQTLSFNTASRDLTISGANGNTVNIPTGSSIPSGSAGGDLGGNYPNPSVDRIRGRLVDNVNPTLNEVLKWDGNSWNPSPDTDTDNQILNFNTTTRILSITGGNTVNIPVVGGPPSGGAGGDLGGNYPNPSVDRIRGRVVDNVNPALNEVLKWDGNSWNPSPDTDTDNQILNFNTTTRILSITGGNTVTIPGGTGGGSPTGSAGGDLSGTYPNPNVGKLWGRSVDNVNPGTNEVLKWDGNSWNPSPDADNQILSFNPTTRDLSISGGNSVNIPGGTGSSLWFVIPGTTADIRYNAGDVYVGTGNGDADLTVDGEIKVRNSGGQDLKVFIAEGGADEGQIDVRGPNGSRNALISQPGSGKPDYGFFGVHNENSVLQAGIKVEASSSREGTDKGKVFGHIAEMEKFEIKSTPEATPGTTKGEFYLGSDGEGRIILFGPNGSKNVVLARSSSGTNNGFIGVHDSFVTTGSQSLEAAMEVNSSGQGFIWGDIVQAFSFVNLSDFRLKTDIIPLSYGLSTVMQLKPVSYKWKSDEFEERKLGLIAQEVQKSIPEVVVETENSEENLGIMYMDLVPVLVKAIQEQNATIEDLRKELHELKLKVEKQ